MDNAEKYFKQAKEIINQNKKYIIRSERLYELKEGKTDVYLSTIIPYSRPHLNDIFTGKRNVDRNAIEKILKPIFAESVKLKEKYEKNGMDEMICYFFKEI